MKFCHTLSRLLLVLLLLVQVSAAYAMPAGAHLNLCIGFDGHIELSPDGCASTTKPVSRLPEIQANEDDHHDDCLDVAIGCVVLDEMRPPRTEVSLSAIKARNNNTAPALIDQDTAAMLRRMARTPSPFSFRLTRTDLVSSHLVSLRTIVLLI